MAFMGDMKAIFYRGKELNGEKIGENLCIHITCTNGFLFSIFTLFWVGVLSQLMCLLIIES